MVPVSHGASRRMLRQIMLQPLFFRGAGGASARQLRAVAVDNDHVPCSQLVTVVSLFRIARGLAKVIKVRGSAAGMKLVISGRGPRTGFVPSPGRPIAVGELFGGAIRVGKISGDKDC